MSWLSCRQAPSTLPILSPPSASASTGLPPLLFWLPAAATAPRQVDARRQQLQQKLTTALIYPLLLAVVAVLIVVGLLTYVVPQVVDVFVGMDQTLPLLTRLLIGFSEALQRWGLYALALLAAAMAGAGWLLRQPRWRRRAGQSSRRPNSSCAVTCSPPASLAHAASSAMASRSRSSRAAKSPRSGSPAWRPARWSRWNGG